MIHNPVVNKDLHERGIMFIMDNYGKQFIEWDEITGDDIVIIPAFGTTIEIENLLKQKGIDIVRYNTTCPFVEKVWNRAEVIGKQNYTIIIHGKAKHEETRATFSHSIRNAPSLIVRNIAEAKILGEMILGEIDENSFFSFFKEKHSHGFEVKKDLQRMGVVNQTTMLATETEEISDYLRNVMIKKYGEENISEHFADTRDTLCYATNDNQSATLGLLEHDADLAVVVGGYNSSNTSHLVELLETKFKTFFISGADKIISRSGITHFDMHKKKEVIDHSFLPSKQPIVIALTSGASCPDSIVDDVIGKILSFFETANDVEDVLKSLR
jgi:4-hydroxy-3-methylbut-2-enyl diphosphate reductase